MSGIIIIGSGECGVRAAFRLRELDFNGDITLIGAEQSLPYERPPLSKETGGENKPIRPIEAYKAAGISLLLGKNAIGLNPEAQTVDLDDGSTLSYDRLLIASGARARAFAHMENCLTLRTDKDAERIMAQLHQGARIGVIGGGFIGLELAATARKLGCDVTVVEAADRLLSRAVPSQLARIVEDRHRSEGVNVLLGQAVEHATDTSITLVNGQEMTFDIVIAGVGSSPNVELAQQAGLDVGNGILADNGFRTSAPNVYAAGDCCSFNWRGSRVRLESWKAAQDQGGIVAESIVEQDDVSRVSVPWFWSDQYDLTLQVAGLFEAGRPVLIREDRDDRHIVFQCDEMGQLTAAAGIGPGNSIAKDIRIFEKLIEKESTIDPDVLSDPAQNLKRLLRTA